MPFAGLRATVLATCLAFPALTAQADPVTVATAAGPLELAAPPASIVALDVAAIDTLSALGIAPAGIVAPVLVGYLDDVTADSPHVGTLFEADFERIAALRPDLIVVGGRSLAQADALGRIAPVADMSIGTDVLADGLARLDAYAAMTGTEARAAEIRQGIEARLDAARALVADRGTALILMVNGPKLSVFGPDSRFGWLHTDLGWPTAVDHIDGSQHGEAVSFEYVAEADPDTLIVIDRAAAIGQAADAARATLDNALIGGTKAARTGRILYLSPAELYIAGGGVQAIGRTLDELIAELGKTAD